jgi:hypothetical protein
MNQNEKLINAVAKLKKAEENHEEAKRQVAYKHNLIIQARQQLCKSIRATGKLGKPLLIGDTVYIAELSHHADEDEDEFTLLTRVFDGEVISV